MNAYLSPEASDGSIPSTLIVGAQVIDGTGAPARPAELELSGGRIVAVHPPGVAPAANRLRILDATGLVVAPGFIDTHAHTDNSPFIEAGDTDKIRQGVTTEVVGNCGFSLAPASPDPAAPTSEFTTRLFPETPDDWHSFAEFLARTDAAGYVTNYVPLVGHGALRWSVAGMRREIGDVELKQMIDSLDEALAAGAFGLSSGLIYPPGAFSEPDELQALTRHLPATAVYATHMRNEGARIHESLDEAFAAIEGADCGLHISHLKLAGRSNWGDAASVLHRLNQARGDGLRVTQDAYPYAAGSTTLTACLPPWAYEGGDEALLGRLTDDGTARRLRDEVEQTHGQSWENYVTAVGYDAILIASTTDHDFEGLTIAAVAERLGCEPFEALRTVLIASRLKATMVVFAMDEGDVRQILADPNTMIGSDGLPAGLGGRPHPRQFGTFPRVLGKYVRAESVLSLPEAVRRMTSLPAATFGITDRGVIRPGAIADLVAFDPITVTDRGTYAEPTLPPDGIAWVLLAGALAVADGRWSGVRSGRRIQPLH